MGRIDIETIDILKIDALWLKQTVASREFPSTI